jgi:hypothetical protein
MRRLLFAVALCASALRAQNTRWVEVTRRETLRADRTPAEVKHDALYGAIAEAVRRVAGVQVRGSQLAVRRDSAGVVTDDFVQAVHLDAAGRATDWVVVKDGWHTERVKGSDIVTYDLTLRVQVASETGTADPAFGAQLALTADRYLVRADDPARNDELIATVQVSRDAALTLVSITDDSVFVLFPNRIVDAVAARAGEQTELPAGPMREIGLRLRVTLPPGVRARRELVAVVATRGPVPIFAAAGAGGGRDTGVLTLAEFNRWLAAIPLGDRAVAQRPILVQRTP